MENSKIVLFDGICNLCNSFVQRIIKNDSKDLFRFASLQSSFGQGFLKDYNLERQDFKTLVLLENNKYYTKSTAVLRIGKELRGIYKLSVILLWIPRPIRDFVYDIISKNRYRWFGKQESCWLPTPGLASKFID